MMRVRGGWLIVIRFRCSWLIVVVQIHFIWRICLRMMVIKIHRWLRGWSFLIICIGIRDIKWLSKVWIINFSVLWLFMITILVVVIVVIRPVLFIIVPFLGIHFWITKFWSIIRFLRIENTWKNVVNKVVFLIIVVVVFWFGVIVIIIVMMTIITGISMSLTITRVFLIERR